MKVSLRGGGGILMDERKRERDREELMLMREHEMRNTEKPCESMGDSEIKKYKQ